ncbi:hypothetical protein [Nostoc sp.]|uniref:hypothetical protein n=1 Tax=Nostoc sp. TaxID=1180 RepID=UPI002FFD345B
MDFKSFSELREFIRRYNSTSVLEIGAKKCWQKWEPKKYSDPLDWLHSNTERNYAVRLMLLASGGNPYRRGDISVEAFDSLINAYHNWDKHTISDKHILDKEAEALLSSIQKWEIEHEKIARNWSFKLSNILDLEVIHTHVAGLFLQRLVAFQNAGFGYPVARIHRTIKLIELLDKHSDKEFLNDFLERTKLSKINYFKQILGCLMVFGNSYNRKGFWDFSQFLDIDDKVKKQGINTENIKIFVKQNSKLFSSKADNSFRNRINQTLNSVPDYYQPLFYNYFLEVPFIKLNSEKFCLPDPFSFSESCWNQIRGLFFEDSSRKRLEGLLSRSFEDYLENTLLPFIIPNSFHRIPEVKNPTSSKDKRADFLIETLSSYIVLECKSSIMSADTSAYFHVDKLADLWCRIHSAFEQIGNTVKAFNLHDKPVIPLILTFYDSIAASTVFEEMVKHTDYCSRMGLNLPPIVYSLHEFEHWISDRSLNNWAESILSKHNASSPIQRDNKGHNYGHLNNISIL